jgi:ubiquinol-cytochrome c reductase iron-sulfur subunit
MTNTMKPAGQTPMAGGHGATETRRDFLYLATAAVGGMGAVSLAWPFIDQMNPSADVLALKTTEVDITAIEMGQSVTVVWQGKPVFIRRRNAEEIAVAESVDFDVLRDPQADVDRAQKPEWLILVGVCTHLGCIPLGQKPTDERGAFGGWYCPCHGSHYDTSGRIRRGPAPTNLLVPPYVYLTETLVLIGESKAPA